jgi:H/ACA ribonucleoprotein complex subunit 3
MKREILKCPECDSFTIKKECDMCKVKTESPKPAKYSPEDKYGKYRRKYKQNVIQN